ncbi:MAG TPA: YceD family protein [Actinomycetota bacterium]|nr:YceD family protein [Actinomycetota bacterium]
MRDVDVRDLLEHPGASRTLRVSEGLPNLATELASVPDNRAIGAEFLLESVVDGVLVTGSVSGEMTLTCARCLKTFEAGFDLRVHELFSPEATEEDDEYPVIEGFVDLEPMIRDAVVPAMPFAPLCRPDCQGLCERCGGDRNFGECACPPEMDSRWAPLASLRLPDDDGPAIPAPPA